MEGKGEGQEAAALEGRHAHAHEDRPRAQRAAAEEGYVGEMAAGLPISPLRTAVCAKSPSSVLQSLEVEAETAG